MLLGRLSTLITTKEQSVFEKINGAVPTGAFLTEVAAKIVWLRQQAAQLDNLSSICSNLLDDLPGYKELSSRIEAFAERLKTAEQEQFDQWCRETVLAIDDSQDSLTLETRGQIMVLDQKKGLLTVNYSDRLLRLLKEVGKGAKGRGDHF